MLFFAKFCNIEFTCFFIQEVILKLVHGNGIPMGLDGTVDLNTAPSLVSFRHIAGTF